MANDNKPTMEYAGQCAGCGGTMNNFNQSTTNPDFHKDCDPDNKDEDDN